MLPPDHWARRAENARVTAEWISDRDARAILRAIALLYDQLIKIPAAYSFQRSLSTRQARLLGLEVGFGPSGTEPLAICFSTDAEAQSARQQPPIARFEGQATPSEVALPLLAALREQRGIARGLLAAAASSPEDLASVWERPPGKAA